ncbi:vacuolar protein sorting 18, putative [Eimeria maxima]|uniref:Vacuolar protein sorting 18, putative n=1 Tax=Eimeria maxima TaxID=5804 RepID=U6MGK9_EIMMA|nr:vacuolar protein sorting 18, putative [Eimeria maxima]CDJ61579.1 vacuolar protein sorting 18, putative [Eimeria maxima]
MLSQGWDGKERGAPGGPPPFDVAAGAAASALSPPQSSSSSSSSSESPSLQLRILRLSGGPSLHARGGAAAAAAAAECTYISTVDGSLIRTEGDGQQMQVIEFSSFKEHVQLRRLFLSPSGTRCGAIMECVVGGGKERQLRQLLQLPKSAAALSLAVLSPRMGPDGGVGVLLATETELLCFFGVGGVAAAFSSSSSSSSSSKNNHAAAISDAVAYEVSPAAAAAAATPSCLTVDSRSSTDPNIALYTVHWLSPVGLLTGELRLPATAAAAAAAAAAAGSDSGNMLSFPPEVNMFLALPQHLYGKGLQLVHDSSSTCSSSNSNSSSSKEDYSGALAACRSVQQREIVLRSKARELLQQQQWVAAAAALASCCSVGFDDACCLLLALQQQLPQQQQVLLEALRVYVTAKLQQLADANPTRKTLKRNYRFLAPGDRPSPQQVVLFTWLLQLLLQQLNAADAEILKAASAPIPAAAAAAAAAAAPAAAAAADSSSSSKTAELEETLQQTQREIRRLLAEFKHATVVGLLQSSGRSVLLREFLLMIGDEETCARLFLNSAQYRDALDAILSIQNPDVRSNLFAAYSPLLLLHYPQQFAAAARKSEFAALQPWLLLPALTLPIIMLQREQQQQGSNSSSNSSSSSSSSSSSNSSRAYACWKSAVQLVKHFALANGNKPGISFSFGRGGALHANGIAGISSSSSSSSSGCSWASPAGLGTALLLLLAEAPYDSESELASAIADSEGAFDALLCLRHCQEKKRRRAVILLYVHLKRYQAREAVHMALEAGDVSLAEEAASCCGDELLKRNLWLDICRYIAKSEDGASLLTLVERSKHCIKIQDLLPLLPDAALLRDVAPALRAAAAAAQRSSNSSRNELQQHLTAIRDLKDQLQAVNRKCIIIDPNYLCDICGAAVICPDELARFDRSVEALATAVKENSPDIETLEE